MIRIFYLCFLFLFFLNWDLWAQNWVVSSYPLSKICQELFPEERLYFLSPPKGEFHFSEPTFKDWEAIKRAELIILVGSEPWAKKVHNMVPKEKIIALASLGERLPDPHLWFDFNRIEKFIQTLVNHPTVKAKPYYKKANERADNFLKKLSFLQKEYASLSQCKEKEFYTLGHQVFYYLFKDLGIKENSLVKGHHHGEISLKRLKEVLTVAKKRGVKKILLTEKEFVRYKDIFLREGFQVFEAWPGDYDLPGSYLQLMERNLEVFKNLLNCF
ncbi:MAG: metal ABC transporter substrate-binding protein [Caldimicrobium sp.]